MTTQPLDSLAAAGVSVWLDDLSRQRLNDGSLQRLVSDFGVRGVTTNPAIFHKAITGSSDAYDTMLTDCQNNGFDAAATVKHLTVADVADACDVFLPLFHATEGIDGRVSIEVDPRLAHDTQATITAAKELHAAVNRPNVMIKIPATLAGLPAITAVLAAGISVNVTLIFSVDRYRAVMDAFAAGLENARDAGRDISSIHSVASFFVSRVDTAVDPQLATLGDAAKHLLGKAAVANAHLAWAAFINFLDSPRWRALSSSAAPQRPLWASTGVKNPAYSATKYVDELVAAPSVNTMPEPTLMATIESGREFADSISAQVATAAEIWRDLAALGISQEKVLNQLEADGVQQFIDAWAALLTSVEERLAARP